MHKPYDPTKPPRYDIYLYDRDSGAFVLRESNAHWQRIEVLKSQNALTYQNPAHCLIPMHHAFQDIRDDNPDGEVTMYSNLRAGVFVAAVERD